MRIRLAVRWHMYRRNGGAGGSVSIHADGNRNRDRQGADASAARRTGFRFSPWYARPVFKQDFNHMPWSVSPVGDLSQVPAAACRPISAQVPGCIHLDLIRAGIIKHPREGFAELDQFWVGKSDWRYECRFEADPLLFEQERLDLVCDGLDTIATLELNGIQIGSAANMFHPHRFDARAALKRGTNTLAITFTSPLRHIREEEARLGARPVNGDWDPYIFIRKAAVNFGWDFAPKVPTCGIWKPIRFEAWSGVRIAGVRPIIRRTRGNTWRVSVESDLEWSDNKSPILPGLILGVSLENHGLDAWGAAVLDLKVAKMIISFDVENPRIWWPNGHGEQPLYYMKLALHMDGAPHGTADGWVGDIGFREVRLHTEPDEHGSKFELHVNGKPIFCKGANWVPDALFPAEVTPERYRERVKQAADANMNMLRVWGGGYYEDEEFYRACDERGILVWQDFMFACAMYPEEPPYPALVEAEARHQITRLSSHASVALWCGGNECVWAYESWGNAPGETPWNQRLGDKTWGHGYYFDLLPRLVAELDPTRPYWANSPWSGSESVPTNGQNHGDRHTWDVHVEEYRTIVPRFCSEFGHQAPADLEALERAIGTSGLVVGSRAIEHRQRATGGTERHIDTHLRALGLPIADFKAWHHYAQLMQRLAVSTCIEWLRIQRPSCMGALVWQFNDPWLGTNWALADADGWDKIAWSQVAWSFAPLMLTIQPVADRLIVFGVNDLDQPWEDSLDILRQDSSLETIIKRVVPLSVPARSVVRLADVEAEVGAPSDRMRESVYVSATDAHASWQYHFPSHFDLPERLDYFRKRQSKGS